VRLPEGHPWTGLRYDDDRIVLCVHGGLTFRESVKAGSRWEKSPQGFGPGYWIGWDYAHAFDDDKAYTAQNIIDECQRVIDQVLAAADPEGAF
jgi:hypothetical protein